MFQELKNAIKNNDFTTIKSKLNGHVFSEDELFALLATACYPMYSEINIYTLSLLLKKVKDPNKLVQHMSRGKKTSLLYHTLWYSQDEGSEKLLQVCNILLKNGVNVNLLAKEEKDYALELACNFLWEDIVKLFLEYGANPNKTSTSQYPSATPLLEIFTRKNDIDAMERLTKLLLEAGAKPDVVCGKTWQKTPLMMAVSARAFNATKLLLEAGANPNHKDFEGNSVLDIANKKGQGEVVKLLSEFGCHVSEYVNLSTQLKDAFFQGNYKLASSIGKQLLSQNKLEFEERLLISYSFSTIGEHEQAIALAEEYEDLAKSEEMISRYITALVKASHLNRAILAWQKYKKDISQESFDPFLIANLLYAYEQSNQEKTAILELEDWFLQTGKGHDSGLMKFNAACIYSKLGDIPNALLMAQAALKEGKAKENFESDENLTSLRKSPLFQLLMDKNNSRAIAFVHIKTKKYYEIILKYKEVVVRESKTKGDLESFTAKESEHENRAKAILDYQNQIDNLVENGFKNTELYSVEYWSNLFIEDFEKIHSSQINGEISIFGAYLVEWDFGDNSCDHNIWIGLFTYNDIQEANKRFSTYVYSNDLVSDNSFTGPPIDSVDIFETIIARVKDSEGFKKVNILKPFYFIYQEHDSGHIHTIVIK